MKLIKELGEENLAKKETYHGNRYRRPHGKMFLVETTKMVGCGHVAGLLLRFT